MTDNDYKIGVLQEFKMTTIFRVASSLAIMLKGFIVNLNVELFNEDMGLYKATAIIKAGDESHEYHIYDNGLFSQVK